MAFAKNFFVGNATLSGKQDDPDGDGWTNEIEEVAGTNPLKPNASVIEFKLRRATGSSLSFLAELIQTRRYEVQISNDLSTWRTIDSFRATTNGPLILELLLGDSDEATFVRLTVSEH